MADNRSEQEMILKDAVTITAGQRASNGGSKQLPADPFGRMYGGAYGLVKPPYRLERLMLLKESNPIHGACLEQKATDIAGLGWHWEPKKGVERPVQAQQDKLEAFFEDCNDEMTWREILQAGQDDYETTGWMVIEVIPNGKGEPSGLCHVPAQTVRAHKDGKLYAQYREGRVRFFKRLGDPQDYDMDSGKPQDGLPDERKAGTVIVIKKTGSRSDFYGIPGYIAALGSIVGSIAVRDYNIGWFNERGMPDCMLIIEGARLGQQAEAEIRKFFNVGTSADGKICILPIPAGMGDQVKARLEKLAPELKDASFRMYRMDNAMEICVAHRVPPYRIGWPITGSLGGATAQEMTEIYKRSVVEPAQEILEHRINNQLIRPLIEAWGEKPQWRWKLNDIDLEDEANDLNYATKGYTGKIMTRNEAREKIGLEPAKGDEEGDKFSTGTDAGQGELGVGPGTVVKAGLAETEDGTIKTLEIIRDILKAAGNGDAWDNFEKAHHAREAATQNVVAGFFGGRRNEY